MPGHHEPGGGRAQALLKAVMKRGIEEEFNPDVDGNLFAGFVRGAVVWARERVEFHFSCGLVLTESLRPPERRE